MSSIVVVDRLTKRYGRHEAVRDVSFTIERGEVVGLLGPNGSGKTTILRLLSGYLQPTSGRVEVAGFDLATDSLEARRHIGYVPEDVPLYANMRVDEFLAFMAGLRGLSGAAARQAVGQAAEHLALGDVKRTAIGKLSRGYRQRVMIAQALLGEPDLVILDEPTNGLDPRQIIEMRGLIKSLAERHTVLVTSHILGEIERVANRVAILLGGRLLAVRTLAAEHAHRLKLRVAGGAPDTVLPLLGGLDGVGHIKAHESVADEGETGRGFSYVVDVAGERVAAEIARALAQNGLDLLEMSEARADLEDLFLNLTEGAG